MRKIEAVQIGNGCYELGINGVKKIKEVQISKTDRTEIWYKVYGKKKKLIAEVNKNFAQLIWYK